jgi:hypothetical protein
MPDDYPTLEAVKARLDIADTIDDGMITSVISAASRSIDSFCNRLFSSEVAQVRYFTADCSGYIDVDDLVSVTTLATDSDGDRVYEDTWAATDYDLEPYNAAQQEWPYTRLMIAPDGNYSFPTVRRSVKITGTWGWPSIPYPVQEACILLTIRWFKRKDSPFGIAGSNELGQVQMMATRDPDVKAMLEPYRKFTVGAF